MFVQMKSLMISELNIDFYTTKVAINFVAINDDRNIPTEKLTLMNYVKKTYGDFDTTNTKSFVPNEKSIYLIYDCWYHERTNVLFEDEKLGQEKKWRS